MKPFCRPLFRHSSVTKLILYLSCSCEPVMRLTTKFYGNCPSPKVTGWILPCAVPPDNLRSGLILAHFQLNTIYIGLYRIYLLTLGTLHSLFVCMVAQLHALRAQQNKHLLSVDFLRGNTAYEIRFHIWIL